MADRGKLIAGAFAGVVVFDPAVIVDRGTPQEPSIAPIGMRHVIVNGELVLRDGAAIEARPGRALRRR